MHDERRKADMKSRAAGILCLAIGSVLTWLSWRWGIKTGASPSFKAATIGPLACVLSVGFLLSGAAMPVDGITPLTRRIGVLGSLAALLNLPARLFYRFANRDARRPSDRTRHNDRCLAVAFTLLRR